MNTQQLHCFLCVADKLNFTKAGEELFLSTPTVTHHIQSLEKELNVKLFHRNKKMVRLTEAGMVFYHDAKEILGKFDMAKKHAEKRADKKASVIRIGCSSEGELTFITHVLKEFRTIYPQVIPIITVVNYMQLNGMMNDRQIDFMFATKEMYKESAEFVYQHMEYSKVYAVVADFHDLAQKEQLVFDDFKDTSLITLHPKMIPFQYANTMQEEIRKHSLTHHDILCENDQVGIAMAAAGYGAIILPSFCAPEYIETMQLKKIPLLGFKECSYGIVNAKKGRTEVMHQFSKLCLERFK